LATDDSTDAASHSAATTPSPPVWVWSVLPAVLVAVAALVVLAGVIFNWQPLGPWRWPLIASAAMAIAAVFLFRRERTSAEFAAMQEIATTQQERRRVADDEQALSDLRSTVLKQLDNKLEQLRAREQALSEQVHVYHQLWEFPPPLHLPGGNNYVERADSDEFGQLSPAALAALAVKDQQLEKLLEDETKALFEKIRTNYYARQGKPDPILMRDDVLRLVTQAARIYQPDATHPLLETSLDRVLRAVHRASLQLMVVLDELPIGVKDRSFSSIYQYVRQGVTAYNTYKQAEPYFPYFNAAYYAGRLAMGAHPLTLGAWWFVGAIGREGARAIGEHLINRQALVILQSLVRTVGTEVATLYGGDYRHRDRYWVYGTELTELVAAFPWSRDSLSQALKEIGSLPLRSEYDRIFLTRCLAAKKSADPGRYHAASWLSVAELRGIAERLEKFVVHYVHGRTKESSTKWQKGVEERLVVKIHFEGATTSATLDQQKRDAAMALVSFLLSCRTLELEEAIGRAEQCKTWKGMTPDEQSLVHNTLRTTPPYVFEPPDLDPDGLLVAPFVADLANLTAQTHPQTQEVDDVVRQAAIYLRVPASKAQTILAQAKRDHLLKQIMASGAPTFDPHTALVSALLDLAWGSEQIEFVYDRVTTLPPPGHPPEKLPANLQRVLVGFPDRMVLIEVPLDENSSEDAKPRLVWKSESTVKTELVRNFMTRACRIVGGQWLEENRSTPTSISVAGPLLGSSDHYFRPLLMWRTESPLTP
jgi:hypothetical protein